MYRMKKEKNLKVRMHGSTEEISKQEKHIFDFNLAKQEERN